MNKATRYPTGRRRGLAVILPAIWMAAGVVALGSVFLQEDVRSLSRRSEAIVRGRVVAMESLWNRGKTMIFTDVTLEVVDRFHGAAPAEITVRVLGGSLDGYRMVFEGAARFYAGEEYVVFVGRWPDGTPRVAGHSMGLSRVIPDGMGRPLLRGGVANGLPIPQLIRALDRSAAEEVTP